MIDIFRVLSKGQYDNDFSFLQYGHTFPSNEVKGRNIVYRYRHRQYTGEYSRNKKITVRKQDQEMEIPYKVLSVNYFKLLTNKMTDLVFNNELVIRSGDIERDKLILALVDKYNWVDSIRKGFKKATIFGDACLKTTPFIPSAFDPMYCFKVVNKSDINETIAYVLYEYLSEKRGNVDVITHIRFEIHFKGKIYECVKQFTAGTLGLSVDYTYRGRLIPKGGQWFDTGIDEFMIQYISINQEADGVYGESLYTEITDIVYALEQRISTNKHLLDNSMAPILAVSGDVIQTDEQTGKRSLKLINGQFLVSRGENIDAKPVELTYNLDQSNNFIEMLKTLIYELTEMGKTFLTGEYSGNISEESLNNIIKGAIDKGNRLITESYTAFRDSLYVLCRLNGIAINKEDISIQFNVGRADDDKTVADVSTTLITNKVLSKATVREKYYGMNKEQSEKEDIQIELENGSNTQQLENIDDVSNKEVKNIEETKDSEKEIGGTSNEAK